MVDRELARVLFLRDREHPAREAKAVVFHSHQLIRMLRRNRNPRLQEVVVDRARVERAQFFGKGRRNGRQGKEHTKF